MVWCLDSIASLFWFRFIYYFYCLNDITSVIMLFLLGVSSVMVARGALWNASIFNPKGKLPWEDVKREYVRKVFCSHP